MLICDLHRMQNASLAVASRSLGLTHWNSFSQLSWYEHLYFFFFWGVKHSGPDNDLFLPDIAFDYRSILFENYAPNLPNLSVKGGNINKASKLIKYPGDVGWYVEIPGYFMTRRLTKNIGSRAKIREILGSDLQKTDHLTGMISSIVTGDKHDRVVFLWSVGIQEMSIYGKFTIGYSSYFLIFCRAVSSLNRYKTFHCKCQVMGEH